jgi:hypothetical protein
LLFPEVATGGEVADLDAQVTDFVLFGGGTLLPEVATAMEEACQAYGRTAVGREVHGKNPPTGARVVNTLLT